MSWASLGRPDRAAASLDDALAELLVEVVADVVEDDSVVEEDSVEEDVSVVEETPGNLTPKFCAATCFARSTEKMRTDMHRS